MATTNPKSKSVSTNQDDGYAPHNVSDRELVTEHEDGEAEYDHPELAVTAYDAPIQQLLYKSYTHAIQLYHFKGTKEQVTKFQKQLTREEHGLIETRLCDDTIASQPRADGDETPEDCIEVAYLPKIFHKKAGGLKGSALGFRVGGNHIEWMCFDRPVDEAIFNKYTFDPTDDPKEEHKLFDAVAELPKGIEKGVRHANVEHRLWYGSLASAESRPFKLKVTWKGKGRGYKETLEQNKLLREADRVETNPLSPNNSLQQAGAGSELQLPRSAYEPQSGQRRQSILKLPATGSTISTPNRRISWANDDILEQVVTFTRDSIITDRDTDVEDMEE